MADVASQLVEDGYRFATQAVAYDQKGDSQSAAFFYVEAANSLHKASTYDNSLDVRDKLRQYVERAEVLRRQQAAQQQVQGQLKTSEQNTFDKAKFLLNQALLEDEKQNITGALAMYGDATELCLNASKSLLDHDPLKTKFNHFARQALERAEALKKNQEGARKPTSDRSIPVTKGLASINLNVDDTKPEAVKGKKYTPQELAVLKLTSKINGKLYLPWSDLDLKERFAYPVSFSDKDGVLPLSPKQKNVFAQWVRPTDIYDNPEMIYAISSFNVKQTIVSDCSFVSSLAISAAYERDFKKRIITSIIFPQNRDGKPIINPSGKYMIKLWLNGAPRKVIIDDSLPMGVDGNLLCSHSTNRNEMWISIIEKAYMKVMGGYDFPGSNSSIDLYALTGWIPERMSLKKSSSEFNETTQFDRLMRGLRQGDCLLTVATGNMTDDEGHRAGLVPTHAYAVLDIRKVMGRRLLMLKNPWSHMRWKGKFSERDTESWTPELERALNYNRKKALEYDNGVFWIEWETLLHFFDVVYMNWNPKLFKHRYTTHATWEAKAGPVKDAYNIGDNPQYKLNVNSKAESFVWILLIRHITQKDDFAENREFITVHVYKSEGKRIYYPGDPYLEGTKINSPFYLAKVSIPAGRNQFNLIVSQYEKTNTIHYTLRVFSSTEFQLSPIIDPYKYEQKVKGSWTSQTAGGCPNYSTYSKNPVYGLELKSPITSNPAEVLIKLLAPKQFSVGVMLRSVERTSSGKPVFEGATGSYRPGFYVNQLSNVPAGSYQIIPSTFLPNQEGPFLLSVGASCQLALKKL